MIMKYKQFDKDNSNEIFDRLDRRIDGNLWQCNDQWEQNLHYWCYEQLFETLYKKTFRYLTKNNI